MKTLYLVATPIGNIEDITQRAVKILKETEVIACEDTRKTGLLLQRLKIKPKKFISLYEENEIKRIPEIINLLALGQDVSLVSNAGTPAISDPGYKLIRKAIENGIKVIPVPGPSVPITALVASGLPTDKFLFLGYLPKKEGQIKKTLENLQASNQFIKATIIFYESPYRLIKTLKLIREVLGDINIVLARELTKTFEELRREKISDALLHFEKCKPLGEFTLLFNLNGKER